MRVEGYFMREWTCALCLHKVSDASVAVQLQVASSATLLMGLVKVRPQAYTHIAGW